jgi:hypothetical protein
MQSRAAQLPNNWVAPKMRGIDPCQMPSPGLQIQQKTNENQTKLGACTTARELTKLKSEEERAAHVWQEPGRAVQLQRNPETHTHCLVPSAGHGAMPCPARPVRSSSTYRASSTTRTMSSQYTRRRHCKWTSGFYTHAYLKIDAVSLSETLELRRDFVRYPCMHDALTRPCEPAPSSRRHASVWCKRR